MMDSILQTSWVLPEERAKVIDRLLYWELIKFDEEGRLPLTGGGTTDIYINLRDARNYPRAISFLAKLFVRPLQQLGVSRFVEVPTSISCLAGPLSVVTGLPYLTIEKGADNSRVIGRPHKQEKVCVIDDAITDGGSKVSACKKCHTLDLNNRAVVVLVDRQGGWQENFRSHGITTPVWAGMTLNDIRTHLSS